MEESKKLTFRLNKKYNELIVNESKNKGYTQTHIIEAALDAYFSPTKEEKYIAAISQKLLLLDREITNNSDSLKILSELVTVFLKEWILHNPDLSEQRRNAYIPQMLKRHDKLLQIVAKNISEGKTIFDN